MLIRRFFAEATVTKSEHILKSDEIKAVLNIFLLNRQDCRSCKRLSCRFAGSVNLLERKKLKDLFHSNYRSFFSVYQKERKICLYIILSDKKYRPT
jgi:hypothetical protein